MEISFNPFMSFTDYERNPCPRNCCELVPVKVYLNVTPDTACLPPGITNIVFLQAPILKETRPINLRQ